MKSINRLVTALVLASPISVASTASVSNDVTYGMLHGTVRFFNTEVTAVSDGIITGNEVVAVPGASITLQGQWQIGPVTDISYCPFCKIQLYAAWIPPAAENGATPYNQALWSGYTNRLNPNPGSSGNINFTTTVPSVAGVYYIGKGETWDYNYWPYAQGRYGWDTTTGPAIPPITNEVASFKIVVTNDFDFDGVANSTDTCPSTPANTVVNGDGCSIAQLVLCDGPWKNHGQYVSSVAKTANLFEGAGLITQPEKDAIVSAAAESQCGK